MVPGGELGRRVGVDRIGILNLLGQPGLLNQLVAELVRLRNNIGHRLVVGSQHLPDPVALFSQGLLAEQNHALAQVLAHLGVIGQYPGAQVLGQRGQRVRQSRSLNLAVHQGLEPYRNLRDGQGMDLIWGKAGLLEQLVGHVMDNGVIGDGHRHALQVSQAVDLGLGGSQHGKPPLGRGGPEAEGDDLHLGAAGYQGGAGHSVGNGAVNLAGGQGHVPLVGTLEVDQFNLHAGLLEVALGSGHPEGQAVFDGQQPHLNPGRCGRLLRLSRLRGLGRLLGLGRRRGVPRLCPGSRLGFASAANQGRRQEQ